MKNLICIICPAGCKLEIIDEKTVLGNKCSRGFEFALSEITCPKRVLTTTVKTTYLDCPRLSVKSNKGLSKDLIFEAMKIINTIIIDKNVKIGDVILENIFDTKVDIIATKSI